RRHTRFSRDWSSDVCSSDLDPPLHEFLPRERAQIDELAEVLGVSALDLERKVAELSEFNPMLGHRGVRLAISYPELPRMQVRARSEERRVGKEREKRRVTGD